LRPAEARAQTKKLIDLVNDTIDPLRTVVEIYDGGGCTCTVTRNTRRIARSIS
jgi:hypothetical protein